MNGVTQDPQLRLNGMIGYELEKSLQQILVDEELQWQRRGGEKWILAEDSNSSYFHKCADGRRRKTQITMLAVKGQEVVEAQCLKEHITSYYKQLFGDAEVASMHLDQDLWSPN